MSSLSTDYLIHGYIRRHQKQAINDLVVQQITKYITTFQWHIDREDLDELVEKETITSDEIVIVDHDSVFHAALKIQDTHIVFGIVSDRKYSSMTFRYDIFCRQTKYHWYEVETVSMNDETNAFYCDSNECSVLLTDITNNKFNKFEFIIKIDVLRITKRSTIYCNYFSMNNLNNYTYFEWNINKDVLQRFKRQSYKKYLSPKFGNEHFGLVIIPKNIYGNLAAGLKVIKIPKCNSMTIRMELITIINHNKHRKVVTPTFTYEKNEKTLSFTSWRNLLSLRIIIRIDVVSIDQISIDKAVVPIDEWSKLGLNINKKKKNNCSVM